MNTKMKFSMHIVDCSFEDRKHDTRENPSLDIYVSPRETAQYYLQSTGKSTQSP